MIATTVGGRLPPSQQSASAESPTWAVRARAAVAAQERAGLDLLAVAVADLTAPPDAAATVAVWQAASAGTQRPVKAVLPGPFSGALTAGSAVPAHLSEWTRAVNAAARALAAAGAPWIEIDEPALVERKGDWPLAREALVTVAADVTAPLALATWGGDVLGLDGLLGLPFQLFHLDFVAGPRNWTLVDTFPRGPSLGLGIVDARSTTLEYAASLGNVLWRATQTISPARLHVHPNMPLDALPAPVAEAKLALVAQVVRAAGAV